MRLNVPRMSRSSLHEVMSSHGVTAPLVVVGIRNFFLVDQFGGIYRDAVFVVTKGSLAAFNASLGVEIPDAESQTLLNGVWGFRKGTHAVHRAKRFQYPAFVQDGNVTVLRDTGKKETGMLGIEICRGSITKHDHLGCQMVHPYVWDSFYSLVTDSLFVAGENKFPYILTDAVHGETL